MNKATQQIRPRPASLETSLPPLPPGRRRFPVRRLPDGRGDTPRRQSVDELLPDDDDDRWGAAGVVDPDFDDFGEDLDHIVGRARGLFDEDDDNWQLLRP